MIWSGGQGGGRGSCGGRSVIWWGGGGELRRSEYDLDLVGRGGGAWCMHAEASYSQLQSAYLDTLVHDVLNQQRPMAQGVRRELRGGRPCERAGSARLGGAQAVRERRPCAGQGGHTGGMSGLSGRPAGHSWPSPCWLPC